jgi:hypothetical protein
MADVVWCGMQVTEAGSRDRTKDAKQHNATAKQHSQKEPWESRPYMRFEKHQTPWGSLALPGDKLQQTPLQHPCVCEESVSVRGGTARVDTLTLVGEHACMHMHTHVSCCACKLLCM